MPTFRNNWFAATSLVVLLGLSTTQLFCTESGPKRAISDGIKWIEDHPATLTDGGLIEMGEEIMAIDYVRMHDPDKGIKARTSKLLNTKIDGFAAVQHKLTDALNKTNDNWCLPLYLAVLYTQANSNSMLLHLSEESLRQKERIFAEHADRSVFVIWNLKYLELLYGKKTNSAAFNTAVEQSVLAAELKSHNLLLDLKRADSSVSPRTFQRIVNDLTHEIFALTAFGRLPPPPILKTNSFYLNVLFSQLIEWAIVSDSPDFVAYSLVSVRILALEYVQNLQLATAYLLSKQNSDGSFGRSDDNLRHRTLLVIMSLEPGLAKVESSRALENGGDGSSGTFQK